MPNIEEFRASLTMRRETMLRMAERARGGQYKNAWSYYRGYERGLRCALEYLEDVDLPDGWEPAPNLEREVDGGLVFLYTEERFNGAGQAEQRTVYATDWEVVDEP